MKAESTENKSTKLHSGHSWDGKDVTNRHGPLSVDYLTRIHEVMEYQLSDTPRTLAVNIVLRLPGHLGDVDSSVITKFIKSIKSQVAADQHRAHSAGKRVYRCEIRYLWVKERDDSANYHYHVCLFFNRDAYHQLGTFPRYEDRPLDDAEDSPHLSLARKIAKAWASALGMEPVHARGLVHFPKNPTYKLRRNDDREIRKLFFRLSYFCKIATKHYGTGGRNFGCSVLTVFRDKFYRPGEFDEQYTGDAHHETDSLERRDGQDWPWAVLDL